MHFHVVASGRKYAKLRWLARHRRLFPNHLLRRDRACTAGNQFTERKKSVGLLRRTEAESSNRVRVRLFITIGRIINFGKVISYIVVPEARDATHLVLGD